MSGNTHVGHLRVSRVFAWLKCELVLMIHRVPQWKELLRNVFSNERFTRYETNKHCAKYQEKFPSLCSCLLVPQNYTRAGKLTTRCITNNTALERFQPRNVHNSQSL